MFFKKSAHKELLKKAEQLVTMAKKVLAYRRDILTIKAVETIEAEMHNLHQLYKDKATTEKTLEKAIGSLESLLKEHGGTIYPVTGMGENTEMLLVAAILAIGIRTFFFQPFEIPTNSMYPTYNGMTSAIYETPAEAPSGTEKLYRTIALGATHYELKSSTEGLVSVPLFEQNDPLAGYGYFKFNQVSGRKWFGLLPSTMREYTLFVGNNALSIRVPFEFNLDDVIYKTFFPKSKNVAEAVMRANMTGNVVKNSKGLLVQSSTFVKANEAVLNFDILSGDKLFVDRMCYNFVKPKIGDPIVFPTINVPGLEGEDKYFIKRLVGKPGDILEVREPALFRNGLPIKGVAAFEKNQNKEGEYPGYTAVYRLAAGQQERIPAGNFFAMGDNSPASRDSRYFGYVPEAEVIGKACFIFYPFSNRWGFAK